MSWAPSFETTETADDFMRRKLALDAAEESVSRIFAAPLKPNGYPIDGYKPPTHEERMKAILDTAEFLLGKS